MQSFTNSLNSLWTVFSGLRFFFIVLDILIFGVFVYAFMKSLEVRPKFHGGWRPKKRVITLRQVVFEDKWKNILKRFHDGSPEAMRIAIIEADALIDEVLKDIGLSGEHMADRLSQLTADDLESLNRVWKAHRLRNDIVHRAGFSFSPDEGKAALEDYEAFLREIGAIS